MQVKEHRFGPNETIGGILGKYNRHNIDKKQLDLLLGLYNVLNSYRVPRLGELAKIPVMDDDWYTN